LHEGTEKTTKTITVVVAVPTHF